LVEAVVTIPILLLLFSALVFVWHLYQTKIHAMGFARTTLWTYAQSANCGDPGTPSKYYAPPTRDAAATSGITSGAGGPLGLNDQGAAPAFLGPSAPMFQKVNQAVGNVSFSADESTRAGLVLGGFGATVRGHMTLICNEPPVDMSIKSLGSLAVGIGKNVFANW
jgi:hypothetical protein